jgi:hypothetical protein
MATRFQASVNGYGQAVVIDTTVPAARKGRVVATFAKCDDAESRDAASHAATHDTLGGVVTAIRSAGLPVDVHATGGN